MAGYQRNKWEVYDETIPIHKQPDALITKDKLNNIEQGISNAVTDFQIGSVSKGTDVNCEIIADENDPSVKRINMVIPKEVSWLVSEAELVDQSVAPVGVMLNDIILDSKGDVFTIVKNSNGIYILNKRMNIKGQSGKDGAIGPEGKPGINGIDGEDGKDGIKWVYSDISLFDGEAAPETANARDYVLDNKGDIFETLDNLTLRKLTNIHGADGKDGADGKEYYLEIGNVIAGDVASAEIVDHKLNLVIPRGPGGQSSYDLWKSLGNEGSADDFLNFLRAEPVTPATISDSNQGRVLTTLDDILANEEEGIFVDALAVKEMFLKLQEMIENIK
jgi:hypothetical protein